MSPEQARTNEMDIREMNVRDMIHTLTGGRPHLFVLMAYNEKRDALYERIRAIAQRDFSLACIRADEIKSAGYDLLAKIHQLIARAELVVAEISEWSPNVFYEIGYAVGVGKLPLLIIEEGKKVPTDLKGLEVVEYKYDWDNIEAFDADLTNHLRFRMNTSIAPLRDMLEAPSPEPAFLVSSPKYPGKYTPIQGQVYDRRTFGDHLGILGLISAFGSMRGEGQGLELVSAQHSPPDLWEGPVSLYLIGSRKVNPITEAIMPLLQARKDIVWSIDPAEGFSEEQEDWPSCLYRTKNGKKEPVCGELQRITLDGEDGDIWREDYGIILRAPHPLHPNRLVLIMTGAHSLGTGAACLAATRSELIQKIKGRLPAGVLEDKKSSFWVLVKGTASEKDFLLDEDGVSIEEADIYH